MWYINYKKIILTFLDEITILLAMKTKKCILKYLLILILFTMIACDSGSNNKTAESNRVKAVTDKNNTNIETRDRKEQKEVIDVEKHVVTGKVLVSKNFVYIQKNWKSRSMVSYGVIGPFKSKLKKYNGKIVTVKGEATMKNPWSWIIKVTDIVKVK